MQRFLFFFTACVLFLDASPASSRDFFLTIGGGYSPDGNQVSIEKNVLLFQRTLEDINLKPHKSDIFFADGFKTDPDVKVIAPNSVPKANRLMAEFLGDLSELGLTYRNHQIPDVLGASKPRNVRKWFDDVGSQMQSGDRLIVYVTAHGNRGDGNEYNTSIAMWERSSLRMTQFAKLLDQLPEGVDVVAVMVQCYAGGFSRFMFVDGDPDNGISPQRRIGFFATVHDKPAAGCTAAADEASYVEYSSFFWPALSGIDRMGKAIDPPDYNNNGVVSFDEAHAYTVITADTIDIPITTSGEFLTEYGRFGKVDSEFLTDSEPYDVILEFANASQRAILEELSKQLELTGSDRVAAADRNSQPRRGRGRRGRRQQNDADKIRSEIATSLKKRWPELANVLNPVSVSLLTDKADEFVQAVEQHPKYDRYRELSENEADSTSETKKNAKYQRFIRTADNVVFAENLKRRKSGEKYEQYRMIFEAEQNTLARSSESDRGP